MSWFSPSTRRTLDPLLHRKSINFQTCFQGSKNQKNCCQGLQKTMKIDPGMHWKTKSVTSWFVQYLPSDNLVLGAPGVQFSYQKSMQKVIWKQAEKTWIPSVCAKNFPKWGPKIKPTTMKSCSGPPRDHPVAPMVLQGAPEVPSPMFSNQMFFALLPHRNFVGLSIFQSEVAWS